MSFRGSLLILVVFLSVFRICHVENPEASPGPKASSNDEKNSPNASEVNEVKSNNDLSDSSSSSSSSIHTTSSLSSSSSSSSSIVTDALSESSSSSSSEKTISSSELEQLVVPTVAPATPHFDTESITSSLSVIVSVTESIKQEKKPVEEDKPQQDFVLMSNINSEKKDSGVNEEKGKDVEKQEVKDVDEKPSKDESISEKPQEDQSSIDIPVSTPEPQNEKKDADYSSFSVSKDKKEEQKDEKEETKQKKDEIKNKEVESKDKDDDSITAELKQAEEETKSSEEMPSFDEFKRQHLQEEEEKQKNILKQQQDVKDGPETPSKTKTRKKIKQRKQNNYASIDCGAKILKANPEASNIFSILQDNRDLYMLNPCSAKIWFIVELCDNVQVKTIDIANFELFSSTPESFKVYVSGRYPTREWTLLGTFQARDERNLQSFPLDEPIYAKYIKVEMLSHFGSEHYCPLSLFRVFGTSMMEELEDHEAGGQDDGDGADHDDDVAQVLPPDPSVKEDDRRAKSTTNILATVGDTLFNIVKVAAKKLTGVIDSEKNVSSDSLGVSTVAPSSGIVSTTTTKGQDAKPSIVTLIPSDDDDDKINDKKQENKTSNTTSSTNATKPQGQETLKDNTTFYDKIDSDGNRGSPPTSGFTSCELLVRMLGHSSFGCMMGKILYSKRKTRGFTPREESPTRQRTGAKNTKVPPGSEGTPETRTEKGKDDSKENEEKKKGEKESEKMEEKGKKNGKEKIDNRNEEPIGKKDGNENGIISKGVDEMNIKDPPVETKSYSEVDSEKDGKDNVQTSINGGIDPVSIVQPSEGQPSITKPSDSSSDKSTPALSTDSVLTTQPSDDITETKSTQATSSDAESTSKQIEKSKEGSSESETRTAKDDVTKVKSDPNDALSKSEDKKDVELKSTPVESVVSKKEETVAEKGSSTVSTSELSSSSEWNTCASADSLDKSLIKPSVSTSPSECKAPSIATHPKDVDVLEFKILDSAGREGTAHLEKPDIPVLPDKPVEPDQTVIGETPIKESKEQDEIKQSESTSQSDSGPSSAQDTGVSKSVSQKVEPDVSTSRSSSSVEQPKPSIAVDSVTPSEPSIPEQPTSPPDVKESASSESVSPLSPPPVDKAPVVPSLSSIEASLTDADLSVLSKAPSSGAQKESIFMRLTNRIKALEKNLTLSTLYMEKLNQKYRKIVEDMQKNFDKKVNLLTNATRKAEAVIRGQKEQLTNLQTKMDDNSRDMKQFNKKIASLNIQVMERHIIGLFLEVILIMILFIVFRRWDRTRIRRDILRESRTNGTVLTSHNHSNHSSHTENKALGKILNGQLSGREQLQLSFANPNEPESIGAFTEPVAHRHKEEFFPLLDTKKKRNRKRPKSGIITTETSQPKITVSESTNQSSPSLVSVTAGLLFSPARGLLNGFKRSQSMDDSQLSRKSSLPATTKLQKTKSLNIIHENSDNISFSTANSKKGRIPTPPPPPSPQKYWTAGSTNGVYQKRLPGQQASSLKLTQKKGRGLNGVNPYA